VHVCVCVCVCVCTCVSGRRLVNNGKFCRCYLKRSLMAINCFRVYKTGGCVFLKDLSDAIGGRENSPRASRPVCVCVCVCPLVEEEPIGAVFYIIRTNEAVKRSNAVLSFRPKGPNCFKS